MFIDDLLYHSYILLDKIATDCHFFIEPINENFAEDCIEMAAMKLVNNTSDRAYHFFFGGLSLQLLFFHTVAIISF